MTDKHPKSFFSSSRSDHKTISLSIITFANVWWFTNIRCHFSLHRHEIIEQFLLWSTHSPMFDHRPSSDLPFLIIKMRSLNKFSDDEHIRQCLMIYQHPMSFSSSSRSDNWTISLIITTFPNVRCLPNTRCLLSLHRDEIIEKFHWGWTHSPMVDDWAASDVFFSLSRWDHWAISLIITTFANVWWFTNIRCPFSRYRHEIIEQFLLSWTHSPMFHDWRTSDVPFLFIEMRSLNKFSDDEHIRQCLMIDQHLMSFSSSSRSDH